MKTLLIIVSIIIASAAAYAADPVSTSEIIQFIHPTSRPRIDWLLKDDGKGNLSIALWNPSLGAQPSIASLESQRAAAQAAADARGTKAIADAAEQQQVKAFVSALRAGTGTTSERLQRLEKACARLLEDTYR